MTAEELAEMLERAASNGKDITREDFYNIMVKKTFWGKKTNNLLMKRSKNKKKLILSK